MSALEAIGNDIIVGAVAGEHEDVIQEWPNCHPNFVLEELQKVKKSTRVQTKRYFGQLTPRTYRS